MIGALEITLLLFALPAGLACLYLFGLALLSRRGAPPSPGGEGLRFDLVVPAHDEERDLAPTLASLAALDWPEAQRRVLVVADNCRDRTAEVAAAAGVRVLVRDEPGRPGKGFALQHAFAASLADGFADALVVVDADTVVEPGLLRAFAARLARGDRAVQADYAVRNPEAGWRPQLMAIAFALFHRLRSLGRERLGLSTGLRGNGMCLTAQLLSEVPWEAFSEVEDVEYGLRLGERGVRVSYAGEARVLGQMVTSSASSLSQRRRWEGGRRSLARRRALPLLARGLTGADRVQVDLAVDLLIPPLAQLFGAVAVGVTLSAASAWLGGGGRALGAWSACAACLAVYVARGWQLSGTGRAGLGALARAPLYLAWKLARRASRSGSGDWVRTTREAP